MPYTYGTQGQRKGPQSWRNNEPQRLKSYPKGFCDKREKFRFAGLLLFEAVN